MKKLLCISLQLVISISSFSQQTTTPAPMTQGDYLDKAKKQSRVARVLLISGAALTTTGVILASGNVWNEIASINYNNEHSSGYVTGVVLLTTGIASMAGSVPFFVAASKNRHRAAGAPVSFKFIMETQPFIRQGSLVKSSYPAIALRIGF